MKKHYHKLNEEFEYKGTKYVAIESNSDDCCNCALQDICIVDENFNSDEYFDCVEVEREDKKNVIFKKVEK